MNKLPLLILGLALVAVPAQLFSHAPDEVTRLRQEIERLKQEVDALKRQNELLQKENDSLRRLAANGKRHASKDEAPKTLLDLLSEGTVLQGTYVASTGRSGTCSLTIEERNGNKFKATLFHKVKDIKGEGPDYRGEIEGTITGTAVSYRRVGGPVGAVFAGRRNGDYLQFDGLGGLGVRSKSSFRLPE
jgi:hypothetical protein